MTTYYGNTNNITNYPEAFVNAYTPGYEHILQESMDVYAGKTRVDAIKGENKAYDFLGTIDLEKKKARYEDIPIDDMTHNRRWIFPEWYRKGIFVDKEDDIMLHTDPSGDYIQALATGIVRLKNDVIHAGFFADVKGGKAPGDDTYSFKNSIFVPGSQNGRTIVHDLADEEFAVGGESTGLTLNKLQMATRAFGELFVNLNGPRYIALTHKHINDLIFDAKTQSIDTSPYKALAAGTLPGMTWGGWTFVIDYNITLGTDTNDADGDTNVYELPCWVPSGMLFAQHNTPQFSVDRIPRKGLYVHQIAAQCGMNAIRMDEDRVLKIETI
jgi:hypothetical protein